MYVHRSNRAEELVRVLAEVVATPSGDPFAPECIVVQGRGMERWLSLELARRHGVWANPDFPFPRHLVLRALDAVLGPPAADGDLFEPESLRWAVARLLPELAEAPAFAPIRRYLADDERGIKRVQLADRIARCLDQYVVFRPGMVLGWERGADDHWQAQLWRRLVGTYGGASHMAARATAFFTQVRAGARPQSFPHRVSLFGLSTLAPLYVEIFAALAAHVEIHLFVLSPSQHYWGELRSRRDALRDALRHGASGASIEAQFPAVEGHPLLASLGRLGRDFQAVLESRVDYQEPDDDLYRDPGTATLLAAVQSDILNLVHRGSPADAPRLVLEADDESIVIHVCHSPMREVEVLHDHLLALFDADPTLEPHDVVVMAPDIDTYAPFIAAVFGTGPDGQPRIPYGIADRKVRSTDEVIDGFLAVLGILDGRMTATAVLDLLGREPVRAQFGLVGEDLDLVRTWVAESGVRWGEDAAHRAAVGQPAHTEHTWRFGLDRLLLGYTMPGADRRCFAEVLPYDDVEGSAADVLGRLAQFCDTLFTQRRALAAPRPLPQWRDDLARLLDAMLAVTDRTADQHQRLRRELDAVVTQATAAGFDAAVDLETVRLQLEAALERDAPGRAFLSGGVTCCALVPMRSIPFRVVCLLGLNDAVFPRGQRPASFDLIAQRPQPGDRSARDDDRYLFLEALLSARDSVILTYIGHNVRDNADLPPSVVVSELLDTLEASAVGARDRLVIPHPLQPFSPRCFGADIDARAVSYARPYFEGAQALRGTRIEAPTFVPAPLPVRSEERVVTVDELIRFLRHPVRAFVETRLGVGLDTATEDLADREPLELNKLESWHIGDRLLRQAVDGADLGCAEAQVRAAGHLPAGALGHDAFETVRPDVEAIAARWRALAGPAALEPIVVDQVIDDTRLTGVLRPLYPAGLIQAQFSHLGGGQELALWVRHVVLNACAAGGGPRESYLVGRAAETGADVVRFRPLDAPEDLLRTLLRLYWLGQTLPLPLFEKTSRLYADALRKGKSADEALDKARQEFDRRPQRGQPGGESYDINVRQVYGDCGPLDPQFQPLVSDVAADFGTVAVDVFGPLLAHREEVA